MEFCQIKSSLYISNTTLLSSQTQSASDYDDDNVCLTEKEWLVKVGWLSSCKA